MAQINPITDLKINGSLEGYTGPGPVLLTWSPLQYSGQFAYQSLSMSLVVEDGESWGMESGPSNAGNIDATSYTFKSSDINHVKAAGGIARIYLSYSGRDVNGEWITGQSNVVIYTYAENEPSAHHLIRCYIDDKWQDCIIFYFNGQNWEECIPYYYDGSAWQTCSF